MPDPKSNVVVPQSTAVESPEALRQKILTFEQELANWTFKVKGITYSFESWKTFWRDTA